MLHYHVWFNLRAGIAEEVGLQVVRAYLTELSRAGESTGFQLLRNCGHPPRSKLPTYHALVEFADTAALETAMKLQAQRGIHTGAHGRVVEVVCDFHVEIFTKVTTGESSAASRVCEI